MQISEENFPDPAFRQYILENLDKDKDQILSMTELACQVISVNGKGISNLKGIEHFTKLRMLYCGNNLLTTLDVSNNTNLVALYCSDNRFTTLDVSENINLETLDVSRNSLLFLDLTNNSKITSLQAYSCVTKISDSRLDISGYFGFDKSRVSSLSAGLTLTEDTFAIESLSGQAYYKYDCGNGHMVTFYIEVWESGVAIDEINFPDPVFRQYIETAGIDLNKDGYLSQAECDNNENIVIENKGLASLIGIEYFTNLKTLYCRGNTLTQLDVGSNRHLQTLSCEDNQLIYLDLSNNGELTYIRASGNVRHITDSVLDASVYPGFEESRVSELSEGAELRDKKFIVNSSGYAGYQYDCGQGYKTAFFIETEMDIKDIAFPDIIFRRYVEDKFDTNKNGRLSSKERLAVKQIFLENSEAESLKGIEYFTNLESLICSRNRLTALDISRNTSLIQLVCDGNKLTSLDISKNKELRTVLCANNKLTELNTENNVQLENLLCGYNKIKMLDVSKNKNLLELWCENNELFYLDVTNNTNLTKLHAHGNKKKVTGALFDASSYSQFDARRVTDLNAGSTVANNIFVLGNEEAKAEYIYDCGNGNKVRFTINGDKQKMIALINPVNFPDSNFRAFVSEYCDTNKDSRLTENEINEVRSINIQSRDISNLKGIEYFTELRSLNCSFNHLPYINLIHNTKLTSLNTVGNKHKIKDKELALSEYPEMDSGKIADLKNARLENGRIIITDVKTAVTYTYDCGNGNKANFEIFSDYRYPVLPFADIGAASGSWKYDSVEFVYYNNIMNGIAGTNLFKPDEPLTRAMFATVLYRMAGEPSVEYSDRFLDVIDGKYYSRAIIWANNQGIVSGYGDGSYGIDTNITREQIAKMLYEFGAVSGYDVKESASLNGFTDKEEVNGWAAGYMEWAVGAQLISGKPNGDESYRLDPKGEATRAECAKMLTQFMKRYQ